MESNHAITPSTIAGWFGGERPLTAWERRVLNFLKLTRRPITVDDLAWHLRFDPTSALTTLAQRSLVVHPGRAGTVRLVERHSGREVQGGREARGRPPPQTQQH